MLSSITSWPQSKRIKVGLWCSPLIFLALYLGQLLLQMSLQPLYSPYLARWSPTVWPLVFLIFSSCLFWLACAAFTGVCAAFFWRDVKMDRETQHNLTFKSVAITWVITFPLCCNWIVLGIPYLLVFRFAVERGVRFWNSNSPRQWIGDFSDLDSRDDS